jgi:hypothetical protein
MAINRDKPTTTKPATQAAPAVTFTPEQLQQYIDEALAKQAAAFKLAMADLPKAKPQAANGKSDVSAKNDLACIRVFKKAGFKDIQPRINVLTFNKWVEKGFRPVEGSKSLKVANLRLFHTSQVRQLTTEELKARQAAKDQGEVATKRKGAKVVQISEGASPQA